MGIIFNEINQRRSLLSYFLFIFLEQSLSHHATAFLRLPSFSFSTKQNNFSYTCTVEWLYSEKYLEKIIIEIVEKQKKERLDVVNILEPSRTGMTMGLKFNDCIIFNTFSPPF